MGTTNTPTVSPLDRAIDIFRVRQYLDVMVRTRDLFGGVRKDLDFLSAARRAVVPMSTGERRPVGSPFPTRRSRGVPPLRGRVGVVSTGGSGALACLIGVARALEE